MALLLYISCGLIEVLYLRTRHLGKPIIPPSPFHTHKDDRKIDYVDEVIDQNDDPDDLRICVEALRNGGEISSTPYPASRKGAKSRPGISAKAGLKYNEGDDGTNNNSDTAHHEDAYTSPCHLERLPYIDIQEHEDYEHRHRKGFEGAVNWRTLRDDAQIAERNWSYKDPDNRRKIVEDAPLGSPLKPDEEDRYDRYDGHHSDGIVE